jgi:prophage maintenance system killer protein
MVKEDFSKGQIVIYKTAQNEVELRVKLEKETIWLSLDQMALLFDRDKSVISRHIRNTFNEHELNRDSVVAKYATTASDGKTYHVDYYNLDVIISVGYRVKSLNGVKFRQWATKTLKQYIVKGYAINEQRLLEAKSKFNKLKEAVLFLQKQSKKELYSSIEDKVAHLLYLTIKDHPFSDGNKRSAAFLFVYFLDKSQYLFKKSGERKINDNALTALALLVAESNPKEKDLMISIIKNLITEYEK